MNRFPLLAALVVAATTAGCSAPAQPAVSVPAMVTTTPAAAPTLPVVGYTSPPRVTGHQHPSCLARLRGQLPDPACTPGSVGTIDARLVCVPRFSEQRRPPRNSTDPAKTTAMLAYRIPIADKPRVEYDHLIPLSLGGSNDVSNLWPQISDLSLIDEHNSKDNVELKLWRAVCLDQIPRAVCRDRQACLVLAQEAMARSWPSAEKFLGLSPA